MRFINVIHKYINNIDVENTMKVVKYLFDEKCISTDDRLVQNVRLSKLKFVTCNLKIYAAIVAQRRSSFFYTSSASHVPIDTCVDHV